MCREQRFRWYACILVISRLIVIGHSESHRCPSRHERCFHQTVQTAQLPSFQVAKQEAVVTVQYPSSFKGEYTSHSDSVSHDRWTPSISSPPSAQPGEQTLRHRLGEMVQQEFDMMVGSQRRNVTDESDVRLNYTRISTAIGTAPATRSTGT